MWTGCAHLIKEYICHLGIELGLELKVCFEAEPAGAG